MSNNTPQVENQAILSSMANPQAADRLKNRSRQRLVQFGPFYVYFNNWFLCVPTAHPQENHNENNDRRRELPSDDNDDGSEDEEANDPDDMEHDPYADMPDLQDSDGHIVHYHSNPQGDEKFDSLEGTPCTW